MRREWFIKMILAKRLGQVIYFTDSLVRIGYSNLHL